MLLNYQAIVEEVRRMIDEYDLDLDGAVELFNEEYFDGTLTYKQLATIHYTLLRVSFIGWLFWA